MSFEDVRTPRFRPELEYAAVEDAGAPQLGSVGHLGSAGIMDPEENARRTPARIRAGWDGNGSAAAHGNRVRRADPHDPSQPGPNLSPVQQAIRPLQIDLEPAARAQS